MKPTLTKRSEQEVFDDLEALCRSPGYVHVLAYLSFRDNFITYGAELTSKDVAASYDKSRILRTEFTTLMGLMIKHPIDFGLPKSTDIQGLIDSTENLLSEMHDVLKRPMLEALERAIKSVNEGKPAEDLDPFRRGDVLREPIFYGGESAYSFQYRNLALKRYENDNKWLLENKGFQIDHACAVVNALGRLQARKVVETLTRMRHLDLSKWTLLPAFTFSLEELSQEVGFDFSITVAVVSALTAPSPPLNTTFISLGDFNIANALPILRTPEGEYLSLQNYNLFEALYVSPFYWMLADEIYKNFASKHRGDFAEDFVATRMEAVFGKNNVHRNVNIYNGNSHLGEIDVFVKFADRAIVFQCKSKMLTIEARKGNDLTLRDDFKKSVQTAYDQGLRCAKAINKPNVKLFGTDKHEIASSEFREIYLVCVVSDHYPALAIQARQFLKYETDNVIQPPFVCDVFLIDVFAEMLASPLRFLSYLNRRVNYGKRINSINELTILSFHLKQNLWINTKTDLLMLSEDISIDLDTAMTVRREGLEGIATPDGILTRLEGTLVGRLISDMENRPEPAFVDLGFLLLKLSSDALDDINLGVREITHRTRADGQHHDVTLGFSDSSVGLTIHCNNLPNAIAARKLLQHCCLRKYAQRANSWFGLAVQPDDGLPKFGISLSFPWEQEDSMDEAIKSVPMGRNFTHKKGRFKTLTPKRNEACPCGSGRKFKKCCMDKV